MKIMEGKIKKPEKNTTIQIVTYNVVIKGTILSMKRSIDCHGLYVMLIVLASYLKEWGRKNLLKGPWTAVEHLQSSSTIMLDFFLSLTSMRSRFIYTRRCLICNKLPCSN